MNLLDESFETNIFGCLSYDDSTTICGDRIQSFNPFDILDLQCDYDALPLNCDSNITIDDDELSRFLLEKKSFQDQMKSISLEMNSNDDMEPVFEMPIEPKMLGLIPDHFWNNFEKKIELSSIIKDFFNKRTSQSTRFIYKIYNALKITTRYPEYKEIIGTFWVSKEIFIVNRHEFAVINNIKIEKGALFHQHGNFTTHGFVVLDENEIIKKLGKDIFLKYQDPNIVFVKHSEGNFTISTTKEQIIEKFPYKNDHKKLYKKHDDRYRINSRRFKRLTCASIKKRKDY